LNYHQEASLDFGESSIDTSAFLGQHGIFDLLNDASWEDEAAQEHAFVSLRDLDLQQTHPAHDDHMQSNPKYINSAIRTSRVAESELLQNDFKPEQIEGDCRSTPQGPSGKRNAVIKEWLLSNASLPYPSQDQLADLSISSGLSCRQVQVCLSNLRARAKSGTVTYLFHAMTLADDGDRPQDMSSLSCFELT
jgi:hypothetical protein